MPNEGRQKLRLWAVIKQYSKMPNFGASKPGEPGEGEGSGSPDLPGSAPELYPTPCRSFSKFCLM